MTNGIRSASEFELSAVGAHKVVFFDLARVGGEILVDAGEAKPGNGTSDQSCNIGMLFSLALALQLALHIVGAAALSLGGGDEEVVACHGQSAGIPLGRDHAKRGLHELRTRRMRRVLSFPCPSS